MSTFSTNSLLRLTGVAVTAVAMSVSCSDQPTAVRTPGPSAAQAPSLKRGPKTERAALLTDVPVTGTLADGGTFTGTMTATHIAMDPVTRAFTLTGVVNGTATKADGTIIAVVDQIFSTSMAMTRPVAAAAQSGVFRPAAAQASCGILFLNLGPLHLDLLGLVIDLNQVVLAVTAVTGAGNLLGNLLCALLGLLDLPGALAAITQLLDTINNILGGLSNPGAAAAAWIAPVIPAWFTTST